MKGRHGGEAGDEESAWKGLAGVEGVGPKGMKGCRRTAPTKKRRERKKEHETKEASVVCQDVLQRALGLFNIALLHRAAVMAATALFACRHQTSSWIPPPDRAASGDQLERETGRRLFSCDCAQRHHHEKKKQSSSFFYESKKK